MTKRQRVIRNARNTLREANWKVEKRDSIAFNEGSETARHAACKLLAGFYLKQQGWRIDSECTKDGVGEADIIAYGKSEGEAPIVVECETSPTNEVVSDKVDRYITNEPFRDLWLLNVTEMPERIMDAYQWVSEELDGL